MSAKKNTQVFSVDGVLARLTQTGKRYQCYTLACQFAVTTAAMRTMLESMAALGLIRTSREDSHDVFYIEPVPVNDPLWERRARPREPNEFRPMDENSKYVKSMLEAMRGRR